MVRGFQGGGRVRFGGRLGIERIGMSVDFVAVVRAIAVRVHLVRVGAERQLLLVEDAVTVAVGLILVLRADAVTCTNRQRMRGMGGCVSRVPPGARRNRA